MDLFHSVGYNVIAIYFYAQIVPRLSLWPLFSFTVPLHLWSIPVFLV